MLDAALCTRVESPQACGRARRRGGPVTVGDGCRLSGSVSREPMPWSRVWQNASCSWTAMVKTVTRPSYTLRCARPATASEWALPLPGAGCSDFLLHAAIRHWPAHCLPLFDSASVCFALLQQHR
jgi:hypothetical protein